MLFVAGSISGKGAPNPANQNDGRKSGKTAGLSKVPAFLRSIPLPGVEGRIDHLALGAGRKRLFVAELGNDTVEVVNLTSGTVAATIRNLAEPQGVEVAPDLNRLAVSNAGDGSCRIYEATTLKPLGTVDLKDDADNMRYDAQAHGFWVGCGEGALALVDPIKIKRVADIKLPGHPESFQLEPHGNRIFVNVPEARCVMVVDRAKKTVLAQWRLPGAGANFPMALDEVDQRLFVGCRRPAKLLVLNSTTGKEVAEVDLVGDCDDLYWDNGEKRLYATGGAGEIQVFAPVGAATYREIARVKTAAGARTSLFDPVGPVLYVAVPHRGEQQAQIRVFSIPGKIGERNP